ncbi:cysteine--tRNA ligase [Limnochorda pilosa]|uniref:Cysteine--tRNA ligase n=1 Tax=Limnochorda pilosa TaxID=1555112 RepID=A0A0K2SQL5_LIMPI|nr:cysteine--tRNA ligase [Limnochorda pilosa]BAS29109.1 cysteinyl-tRNA synthetase [Limnochorda pilosa]
MPIRIHNTLTGKKEPLETVEPGRVKMYSCGPTVYDYFHVGNARAFVVPDVIKRYLRDRGYQVLHVQNVTDVDDKIIQRAQEAGLDVDEVVDRYTRAYLEDLLRLGCEIPTVLPRARDHVSQMIELIRTLQSKELAYEGGGDVFYPVERFRGYGKLSHQSVAQLEAGARVEANPHKRNPADFVLWKAAKPGEPRWDSPWGPGRPGWHLECSVMSMAYLGERFDIHTGGADLIFPHHENEIAQSEGAVGHPVVTTWVHNGYINVDGEKMSKSLGNFWLFRDAADRWGAPVVRAMLLAKHYRTPIDFTEEALDAQARGMERLYRTAAELRRLVGPESSAVSEGAPGRDGSGGPAERELERVLEEKEAAFHEAMEDDFNTALAMGRLFELAREANRYVSELGAAEVRGARLQLVRRTYSLLLRLAGVLGFRLDEPLREERGGAGRVELLVELLLELRQQARSEGRYANADQIRERLNAMGIQVEDTREGARWSLVEERK